MIAEGPPRERAENKRLSQIALARIGKEAVAV